MKYLSFLIAFSVVANVAAKEVTENETTKTTQEEAANATSPAEAGEVAAEENAKDAYTINAYNIGKTWAHAGSFQINELLTLEDVNLGFRHQGRILDNKLVHGHRFDMKVARLPESYVGKDKNLSRYAYEAMLSTDPFLSNLAGFSAVEISQERWGKVKGNNHRIRGSILGLEYTFKFSGMLKELGFAYIPIYEFENYNIVSAADLKLGKNSVEFFHHALRIRTGFEFNPALGLTNDLQYSVGTNLKTGDSDSSLAQISNNLKLFYKLNDTFLLMYRNDLVNQERREKIFGLEKFYLEQSINVVYRWL